MKLPIVLLAFSLPYAKVNAVFTKGRGAAAAAAFVAEGDPPEHPPSTPLSTNFLNGDLGTVNSDSAAFAAMSEDVFKEAAGQVLRSILAEHMAATGNEEVVPSSHKIPIDEDGNIHVRFQQQVKGHPVEGSSMVMHISSKDGRVYALNGEFSPSTAIDLEVKLECKDSVEIAVAQSGVKNAEWLTDCEEAAVRGFGGLAHLAFKRLVGYKVEGKPYQKAMLFASTVTGDLLALHPLTHGGKSLETWDCKGTWSYCQVVSTSNLRLRTGNPAVLGAHNYAIDTYKFYKSQYGRDSIDDNGLTLISVANYGSENNAWWDGWSLSMTYGGGDGVEFYPFSLAADVVAHEITHGVTQFSSNLIYSDESGAINEGMSDIFGAVIDRLYAKKSVNNTWLLAEDLFIEGGAIRNMQDPAALGHADYYPDRYRGWDDAGGVHNNSGIVNLAFALMVQGGKHPRGKSNVTVPAIDANFDISLKVAAAIFYRANTQCLTQSASFFTLRLCTLMFAGSYKKNVAAAWDAVGVLKKSFTKLQNGVALTGQKGVWDEVREYSLAGVKAGETVTCTTDADNGDADLYLRLNEPAEPNLESYFNDCASGAPGSKEACSTGIASKTTTAYAAVEAYADYSNLSISCFRSPAESMILGYPITGLGGTVGGLKYYLVDYSYWWFETGDAIGCATFGRNGDADLFIKLGSLPSPYDSYDCQSTKVGSSMESCRAIYSFDGVVSSKAFVAVYSSSNYNDLTIQCDRFIHPYWIMDGETTSYLWSNIGSVWQFVLDGVKVGDSVTCTTGGDGDADLYVRFEKPAKPYEWAKINDCKSTGPTSNETCTTGLALADTRAYVAVTAKSDYYDVSLTCSISK